MAKTAEEKKNKANVYEAMFLFPATVASDIDHALMTAEEKEWLNQYWCIEQPTARLRRRRTDAWRRDTAQHPHRL